MSTLHFSKIYPGLNPPYFNCNLGRASIKKNQIFRGPKALTPNSPPPLQTKKKNKVNFFSLFFYKYYFFTFFNLLWTFFYREHGRPPPPPLKGNMCPKK